jgi:hypothetical protein
MTGRTEKSTIPAKGERGLSEFGIGRSYSEARSNDKAGMVRGRAGGAGAADTLADARQCAHLRGSAWNPETACASHLPVSGIGLCMRRRTSSLISRSFKQAAVVTRLRQLADDLDAFSDARERLSIGRAVLRLDLNLAA